MTPAEERWLDEHGFYWHYVHLGGDSDYINAHTHGVPKSFPNQLDFQVVAGLPSEDVSWIFWDLVRRLEKGVRFETGDRVSEILAGMDLELLRTEEMGRPVLRVLLPDTAGRLPSDPRHDPSFFPEQTTLRTVD